MNLGSCAALSLHTFKSSRLSIQRGTTISAQPHGALHAVRPHKYTLSHKTSSLPLSVSLPVCLTTWFRMSKLQSCATKKETTIEKEDVRILNLTCSSNKPCDRYPSVLATLLYSQSVYRFRYTILISCFLRHFSSQKLLLALTHCATKHRTARQKSALRNVASHICPQHHV